MGMQVEERVPAAGSASCSSSRLALSKQPRSLQQACQLFAAKKLALRVLQALREAVATRSELVAIATQHSMRSTQRAVLRRLAIWRAGQQQLALLLRCLVCLRLAVRQWRSYCQRRHIKQAMQQEAAQQWRHALQRQAFATWATQAAQHSRARRFQQTYQRRRVHALVVLWRRWAAALHHANRARLRRSWQRWRSGILARALLTRVFTTMQQCWAAWQQQRELCWAAVAAGMAPPTAAAVGSFSCRGEARSNGFAEQYKVLAASFAGWRLWHRACMAKRRAGACMEMVASYRRTTLLLHGMRCACSCACLCACCLWMCLWCRRCLAVQDSMPSPELCLHAVM
jgi:hypothetical protein